MLSKLPKLTPLTSLSPPTLFCEIVVVVLAVKNKYTEFMSSDNTDIKDEMKLIDAAKTSAEAFGRLYEMYFDKLYGYVFYMTGNHFKTEDVVSDTFEKALLNIHKYEHRGYTFGAWLFRIARNLVIDQSKKIQNNTSSLDGLQEIIEADNNTEDRAVLDIQKEQLKTLLKTLKEEQLECVVLRYIEGYSVRETCEITSRTEDSVKSLCKRALQNLKELVQSDTKINANSYMTN